MSTPQNDTFLHELGLDAQNLGPKAVNGIRAAIGISGVVSLVLGVLVVIFNAETTGIVGILLGLSFLISGLVYAGVGIFTRKVNAGARVLNIVLGALFIFAGVITIKNPILGIATLGLFIGALWIIEGIVTLSLLGDARSKGFSIAYGILSIVAGIIVVFIPLESVALFILVAGWVLVILGISQIVRAFTFGRGLPA